MGFGQYDGDDVNVKGDDGSDDGKKISQIQDGAISRLAVDANVTSAAGGIPAWKGTELNYEDMNTSTNGINRNTTVNTSTWRKVYGYSGSGRLSNFSMAIEDAQHWQVRIVIDGHELFGANGILTEDMGDKDIYHLVTYTSDDLHVEAIDIGVTLSNDNSFHWGGPLSYPATFGSSVNIYVKRQSGAGSKKWRGGLVVISKD